MEDTFVNVDPRSHARQLEMEETFDSSFFGTNQRAAPSKADQQLRVLLDLARQEKIRDEYSEAEWRNNLEVIKEDASDLSETLDPLILLSYSTCNQLSICKCPALRLN